MKKRNQKKIRYILLLLVVTLFCTVVISAAVCHFALKVTDYTVSLDGVQASAKIVCISDLHSREFGKDNVRLLDQISAQIPDAIFVVGDMISNDATDTEVQQLLNLLIALQEIAPVYFAPGNHEEEYINNGGNDLLDRVSQTGAVVVNDSYVDTEIGGGQIRIGGTMGHAFPFGRTWEEFETSPEYVFLNEMEATELPTVVLAHMPDTFIFNNAYTYWNTDLVISGHTHGGVIRVPFVGGVYAPMQGLWPEYDCGYYCLGGHIQMVITSGLAGYDWVPRIFNRPEICIVHLEPVM